MKGNHYTSRTAGFVALNQGSIRNCYADAKVKNRANVAGFVCESGGSIVQCLAQGKTVGKENVACFCGTNRGKLDAAGYQTYLTQMLRAVPPAYHRFYQELSKI